MANDEWKQAIKDIKYSETFYNDTPPYEYRQVMLPKVILENFPLIRLLKEHEWRAMGVEQSPTWVHYANRDGAVMLFRRPCRDNESDSENENEDEWKKAIPRIHYSNKYYDDKYEYRDVILPPIIAQKFPPLVRLLGENEWRAMGVQQSCGWLHYAIYPPEPRILLFRRPLQPNNVEEMSELQET